MPTIPETTNYHSSRKFSILLPSAPLRIIHFTMRHTVQTSTAQHKTKYFLAVFNILKEPLLVQKQTIHQQKALDLSFLETESVRVQTAKQLIFSVCITAVTKSCHFIHSFPSLHLMKLESLKYLLYLMLLHRPLEWIVDIDSKECYLLLILKLFY